jgi:hypothetical protein
MAHQPFDKEEQQFLRSVGLDRDDLEHLVAEAEELTMTAQYRIARRAKQKIAAAAAAPMRSTTAKKRTPWRWVASTAALVASVVALMLILPTLGHRNIALAMEQALAGLNSYHAVIEIQWLQADERPYSIDQSELWVDGDKYAWIGNGGLQEFYGDADYAWWIDHRSKQVGISPNVEGKQIRDRLAVDERGRWVLNNPYKVVGHEPVAGRKATKLEVASPEGYTHYVWIDDETHLPLQVKEWWGRDQIRVVRYVTLEVNPSISPSRFTFNPPAGYHVNKGEVRWVADLAEAAQVSGLTPIAPSQPPRRVAAGPGYIGLSYPEATVEMRKPFLDNNRWAEAVGQADGHLMSIGNEGEVFQWTTENLSITIRGSDRNEALATARLFAKEITLPDKGEDLVSRAKVAEPVDPAKAKALQDYADYRGGPEIDRQDPIEASITFLEEKLGGLPFPYERLGDTSITVTANTGVQAIVELPQGPYARLYLKRLAPNKAGVWMVVGSDPR